MSNYYVSGCVDVNGDVSRCDDNVAQFWTLYHRNGEGLSEGIIDCMFREDAEAAMRVYEQRDALAAENARCRFEISRCHQTVEEMFNHRDKWIDKEWLSAIWSTSKQLKENIPATDAYLNAVRAEGVDIAVHDLKELAKRSLQEAPNASEHTHAAALYLMTLATQLRLGEPS